MKKKVEDLISELSVGVSTQKDLAQLTRMLTKKVLETALNSELAGVY